MAALSVTRFLVRYGSDPENYCMKPGHVLLSTMGSLLVSFPLYAYGLPVSTGAQLSADAPPDKIRCVPEVGYKCSIESCQRIEVVTAYTSQYLDIDLKKNTITGNLDGKTVDIEYVSKEEIRKDAYVLYGTYSELSSIYNWAFRVDKTIGKMVITSVSEASSGTIFGTCHWGKAK